MIYMVCLISDSRVRATCIMTGTLVVTDIHVVLKKTAAVVSRMLRSHKSPTTGTSLMILLKILPKTKTPKNLVLDIGESESYGTR
jgi:hypothetical protein